MTESMGGVLVAETPVHQKHTACIVADLKPFGSQWLAADGTEAPAAARWRTLHKRTCGLC